MPQWVIKWVLPFVIKAVMKALVSTLQTLALRSESDVDDNIVKVADSEQDKIRELILEKIK